MNKYLSAGNITFAPSYKLCDKIEVLRKWSSTYISTTKPNIKYNSNICMKTARKTIAFFLNSLL